MGGGGLGRERLYKFDRGAYCHTLVAPCGVCAKPGIPAEHADAPRRLGITAAQLAQLQADTAVYVQLAIQTLAAKGYYIWQGFAGAAYDGLADAPTSATCMSYMTQVT